MNHSNRKMDMDILNFFSPIILIFNKYTDYSTGIMNVLNAEIKYCKQKKNKKIILLQYMKHERQNYLNNKIIFIFSVSI